MALYHSAKGSVTYTIVGSPTVVDGVISGFSASNYATINLSNAFSADIPIRKLAFQAKFTTGNDVTFSSTCSILAYNTSGIYEGVKIYNSRIEWGVGYISGGGTSIRATSDLSANTTYWVKGYFVGNVAHFDISTDGTNYTSVGTKDIGEAQYVINHNQAIGLGTYVGNTARYFDGGSIDTNETYVMFDGQPYFGLCTVEVKSHQIMGPVGYTKVGSPTITDGIASGFVDGYLEISSTSTIGKNTEYQRYVRFKTPSAYFGSFVHYPLFGQNSKTWTDNVYEQNGALHLTTYVLNGTATLSLVNFYGVNLALDTWYSYEVKGHNGSWTTNLYDDNGNVLATNTSTPDFADTSITTNFLGRSTAGDAQPIGAIDLNNTYIKKDGKLWFYQPAPTKYIIKDNLLVWADPKIYIDDNGTKTYSSTNIACVPSGFTYGNTTTSAIGFVDMRTQVFTPAPSGATIGRD